MEFDDLGFTDAMVDTAFALGWRQATVESLTISLNDHMTGRALQRFATMSSLRKLVVSRCRRITREDIHAFFFKSKEGPVQVQYEYYTDNELSAVQKRIYTRDENGDINW